MGQIHFEGDTLSPHKLEKAVLGGGCFWCLEAAFKEIPGVRQVFPGYCGGDTPAPDYESVCSGSTGHAEVVEIVFDAEVIDFERLLHCFFACHDPTTRDRQGNDVGTQYRSVIFAQSPQQAAVAGKVIREIDAAGSFADRIVTQVLSQEPFWPAEAYHRDYFERNPDQAYCAVVIAPKLARLRRLLPRIVGERAAPLPPGSESE